MKRLFSLSRLTHDSQRILAAVRQFALVRLKLRFHIRALELGVTSFAYANGWRSSLYDPQVTLCHDSSLAHQRWEA
jgi:hypothetical protein